jgi:hypothetical protein
MLYREIIAVCSQIHTKHINALCGQNVELLNDKVAVHIVTTRVQRVRRHFSEASSFMCLTLEADVNDSHLSYETAGHQLTRPTVTRSHKVPPPNTCPTSQHILPASLYLSVEAT